MNIPSPYENSDSPIQAASCAANSFTDSTVARSSEVLTVRFSMPVKNGAINPLTKLDSTIMLTENTDGTNAIMSIGNDDKATITIALRNSPKYRSMRAAWKLEMAATAFRKKKGMPKFSSFSLRFH